MEIEFGFEKQYFSLLTFPFPIEFYRYKAVFSPYFILHANIARYKTQPHI